MSNTLLKTHLTSPIIRYFGAKKAQKHFTKPPIFIGGCARSGTSLLLSILSAHPKIFCFPNETDAFTEWEESPEGLNPVRLDRMYRSLLLHKVSDTATRWCEKRPSNIQYIKEILDYYGSGARFIHIVRDPRAVCTSVHPSNPDTYWVNPDRWVRDVTAGLAYHDHPQVLTVPYELLVLDTQQTIQRICDFIGEAYVMEIEHWHKHATVREHPAWFDGIATIQKETIEKWRAEKHAARVKEVMAFEGVAELAKILDQLA